MVGGMRKITALYRKMSASRKGQGTGRGRGGGKGKGARPPSPVAPSSSYEEEVPSAHASGDEEEVPSAHASSDEVVQEEQEQVEEDAVGPEVWLRGPSPSRGDRYLLRGAR